MYRVIVPAFVAVLIIVLVPLAVHAQTGGVVSIAVLDLDMQEGVPGAYRVGLSDILREELFHTGRFDVIERNKMENILTEQGLQLSGCTSDECAVEAGQLLGVEQMVAGSVSILGELYVVSLRLIDVETGRLIEMRSARCLCPIEEVATTSMAEVARQLAGVGGVTRQVSGSGYPRGGIAPESTKFVDLQPDLRTSPSVAAIQASEGTKFVDPLPGMEFVQISGGSFMMGSPSSEAKRDNDEGPQHRVTIQSFQMMTTEVTQGMWREVMGSNPSKFKGDNLPIEMVSWEDAQDFTERLSVMDRGKGYRLPTEAEWEYACRAATTTRFYSGDSESGLSRVGWYKGNSRKKIHPVGLKEPNAWGLYDMHGNVWEWCEDRYGSDYYASSPATDPVGPSTGAGRVVRGGGWNYDARWCRSAKRGSVPTGRSIYIGFRLVRSSLR